MGSIGSYCSYGPKIVISKDKNSTEIIISDISSRQFYSNKTNNRLSFNRLSFNSSFKQENEKKNKSFISLRKEMGDAKSECKLPYNPLPFVKIIPKKCY